MIARIYVNKHVIMSNAKNNQAEPPISVRTYKGTEYATEIELTGTWKVIYSPEKAICSGAKVWIEGQRENLEIIK